MPAIRRAGRADIGRRQPHFLSLRFRVYTYFYFQEFIFDIIPVYIWSARLFPLHYVFLHAIYCFSCIFHLKRGISVHSFLSYRHE